MWRDGCVPPTINLVEARKLVISDEYLDRLDLIKAELPNLEHVIVWDSAKREGPDPALPHEPLGELMSAPDAEPDGIAYSWTDDARIMFTSGTTGRSKGVIKQNAADYFSARSALESAMVRGGVPLEGLADEVYFSCLPLFHSNAQVLSGYPALVACALLAGMGYALANVATSAEEAKRLGYFRRGDGVSVLTTGERDHGNDRVCG